MPIAEMQARLFFDVFTQNTRLPSRALMEAEMRGDREKMRARYVDSRRHTIQVFAFCTRFCALNSLSG